MLNHLICLGHIRDSDASTQTIMELFGATQKQTNEFIEFLYEEGYIHEPKRMLNGRRIGLKLTSLGLKKITMTK